MTAFRCPVRAAAPSFAAATLLLLLAAATPAPAGDTSVRAVGMTVDDLDRSVAFFTGVLGFEKTAESERAGAGLERLTGVFGSRVRTATLRLGSETIVLTDFLAPRGRPYPRGTRANDRWFQHIAIVVSDMDAAYAKLRAAGVEHASTGPQTLPASIPAAAGIRAFYFRDPDGHFLELLQFPPGKGEARWQARNGRLFLGIDHTAIVVADTARSIAFYRETLGLDVAGESTNAGTEQEHLNNVEHARLRITALRAVDGPGIELLEYLAPLDGRAPRQPVRPHDLAYWQTHVAAGAATGQSAHVVRDPDGHAVLVLPRR
jgi:catechol 2,3-dioxygenase-like lactoylglutathione lyase family enzyme